MKSIRVLSGTGTAGVKQVNILPNVTGPSGAFQQASQLTGFTGPTGTFQNVQNANVVTAGLKNIIINGYVSPSGGAAHSAAATAFIARTSGLDATHTNAYYALIDGLVTDGVWAKLDMLHVYATQNSATALLNLVSTSYNGTTNGSPVFTADRGFTGADGSGSVFINTNFNPTTAVSPQYVRNSAHASAWSLTSAASSGGSAGIIMGAQVAGCQLNIFPRFFDGNTYLRINGGSTPGSGNADGTGHYIVNRSSSSAIQGYRNASSVENASDTSGALFNLAILVLAQNNNGSGATGFAGQCAMSSIGSSLSSGDATAFYNRLRTYMTAVGAP